MQVLFIVILVSPGFLGDDFASEVKIARRVTEHRVPNRAGKFPGYYALRMHMQLSIAGDKKQAISEPVELQPFQVMNRLSGQYVT